MADPIKITGLAEFIRSLREIDAGLPRMVRLALNEAADVVIEGARPRVPSRTGTAAGSIRARSTRTVLRISAGGSKAPYYPWLDFGGKVGPDRSIERKFFKEGRYLYRAYFDAKASGEFPAILSKVLTKVARDAGLEVT